MVDIGLDGIKFEKDDVCQKISEQITSQGKILDGLIQKGKGRALGTMKDKMGELTGLGNGALSDPQDAIDGAEDQAGTAAGAAESLKDKVLGGEIVEGSNASIKTLAECLGGGLPNLGFPSPESPIDLAELGRIMEELGSAILNKIADALSAALSPLENAIADAIDALKSLLPLDMLDELLNLIQCIEDCPNVDQSKIPTLVDVEDKLSAIGLKITGEIDWDSKAFGGMNITEEMKENFNKIAEAKDNMKGAVTSVQDVKLPEVPNIPAIPRPKNPLEGLSLIKKMESLF